MTATTEQIRGVVHEILGQIAPEADLQALDPDVSVREQLDIDSLDFLNFVIGIHERLEIEIPEIDYPKLATLNGCIAYLSASAERRS